MKLRLKVLICRHQSNDQNCRAVILCLSIHTPFKPSHVFTAEGRVYRDRALCANTRDYLGRMVSA